MRFALLAGAAVLAALPTALRAQDAATPSQAVTEGAQIEEAVRRTTGALDRARANPLASDGEGGIYLLDRSSIFFVGGNAGLGYQSNPTRTADNPHGSGTLDASLTTGARLKLGGVVDLTTTLDVAGTKYFERFGPSNTTATGSVALGVPLGRSPFYVGAVGFGGYNFDRFFRRDVSFWGGSAYIAATLPLGRGLVAQPSLTGTRQKAGIAENDLKSLAGRLTLSATHGRLIASVSGGASRVWYDDFYEDVTFVKRRDWQYDGGFSFSYQLAPSLLLTTGARYLRRSSSFELARFKSVDSRVSLGLIKRF